MAGVSHATVYVLFPIGAWTCDQRCPVDCPLQASLQLPCHQSFIYCRWFLKIEEGRQGRREARREGGWQVRREEQWSRRGTDLSYFSFSSDPCLPTFLRRRCAAATSSVFLLRTFCCWLMWSSSSLIFCCCFCMSLSILIFLSASSLSFLWSWSCWFLIRSMFTSSSWTFFSLSSCKALIFSLSCGVNRRKSFHIRGLKCLDTNFTCYFPVL